MLHKWHNTGWVICLVYVCYSNRGRFSRRFYDFSIVFCNWPDTVVFFLPLLVNEEFTFAFIIIHTFYWSVSTRRFSGHTYLWGNDLASVSSIFQLDFGTVWICFFILFQVTICLLFVHYIYLENISIEYYNIFLLIKW